MVSNHLLPVGWLRTLMVPTMNICLVNWVIMKIYLGTFAFISNFVYLQFYFCCNFTMNFGLPTEYLLQKNYGLTILGYFLDVGANQLGQLLKVFFASIALVRIPVKTVHRYVNCPRTVPSYVWMSIVNAKSTTRNTFRKHDNGPEENLAERQ